jgi:hypothetical protein
LTNDYFNEVQSQIAAEKRPEQPGILEEGMVSPSPQQM